MKTAVLATLLALATLPSRAQILHLGEATPLATTRYGAFGGPVRLLSNGTEAFLVWSANGKVRISRLRDGERRVGRPVLDVNPSEPDAFDVVWTGTHFVAVAEQVDASNEHVLIGQLLDPRGERILESFVVAERPGRPRLAFDGTKILMVFGRTAYESIYLDRDGRSIGTSLTFSTVSTRFAAVAADGGTSVVALPELNQVFILAMRAQDAIVGTPHFSVPHDDDRRVAMASGDGEIFILWTNGNAPMEAAVMKASNATISGRFTLPETGGASAISVTRDGAQWLVAWITGGDVHARRIDVRSGTSEQLATQPADDASPVAALAFNGHELLAWRGTSAGAPITVRHVGGTTDVAAFAAAEQRVESAAATAESALIAFTETRDGRDTLYAGLRGVDGSWRETKIADDEHAPLAATDGSNFGIVTTTAENDWALVLLDRLGQFVNVSPHVASFRPTGIAWTGAAYAIVGIDSNADLVAYLVSPSATIAGPTTLVLHGDGRLIENPAIAARDGEVLVVWQDSHFEPCFPTCDPYTSEVHGARFSPLLQRLDAQPLFLAPDEAIFPAAAWDGTRYTIAWNSGGKLKFRTLTSHASISAIETATNIAPLGDHAPRLAAIGGGVAATMATGDVFFPLTRNALPFLGTHNAADAVVTLGTRFGYVQATALDEMPYHGADRIRLTVIDDLSLEDRAAAPRITRAYLAGETIELAWTKPHEEVHGYRVEYRVEDGAWNELDPWFEPDDKSLTIHAWRGTDATYAFRVRAMNDAGPGLYSNEAVVRSSVRRRAVR